MTGNGTFVAIALCLFLLALRLLAFGRTIRPTFDILLLFYSLLIMIPIGIIADHISTGTRLAKIGAYRHAMIETPTPQLMSALAILVFFAAYFLFARRHAWASEQDVEPVAEGKEKILLFYGALAVIYLCIGMLVNDFPLLSLLTGQGGNLRDISFEYTTATNVPLPFAPQIYRSVYRVVLPFIGFMLILAGRPRLGYVFIGIALVFAFGSFKRMQAVYVFLSILIFTSAVYSNSKINHRVLIMGCISLGSALLLTYIYSGSDFFRLLMVRIFVVEAISEYAIYSFYYTENTPQFLNLFLEKFAKLVDRETVTFSEAWKQQIASSDVRGFSSIGIFAELYASFWIFGLFLIPIFSWVVARVDNKIMMRRNLAFYSVLAIIIAAMAMKGVPSQTFTGGLLILLMLQFFVRRTRI